MIFIDNISPEKNEKVLNFLKENSIEYGTDYGSFHKFCEEEAEFRLFELDLLDDETKDKIDNLTDIEKETLVGNIADEYKSSDGILDYDYMDDIVRHEVDEFINSL